MNLRSAFLAAIFGVAGATLAAQTAPMPASPVAASRWVGSWGTASYPNPNSPACSALGAVGGSGETLRQIVHLSLGGSTVRVALTNEYGTSSLVIAGASVGLPAGGGGVRAETLHPLQFGGKPGITIPPGSFILSDPVALSVQPLSDLAISLYLPAQAIPSLTQHSNAVQTNFRAVGNAVSQPQLSGAEPFYAYDFLKSVQVVAPNAGTIVAFGDSITDGAYVTRDSNARWPDELARRLAADKRTADLGVLNEGIGGNRVLHDGTGPNALARLGRDALEQPGVRYIIVLEAINDIGNAYQTGNPRDVVTADDLVQGYRQIIERAHEHGIQVIGATLTPYVGAGYASPAGEAVREAVNTWIRAAGHFDGVIDFDAITRDPANPTVFLPSVDHGDHLHPGDAGYKRMGDSIDLSLFTR